ncbi:MAG: NOL1/NOP2/sun family putative RNA methylase [Kangiellaceae bacterium]|nr:NOL1/NOP2/sun family putative RNA methylase [Kangiellaceae bacterium]
MNHQNESELSQHTSSVNISADFLQHAQASFLPSDQLELFIEACGRPLRKSIRVNTLKCRIAEFLSIARELCIELSPVPWCQQGFWVDDCPAWLKDSKTGEFQLGNLPQHIQGLFYIQEASSMLPPSALLPHLSAAGAQPNIKECRVLDLAAAPGSKTTQIAALLNGIGTILANELSASRVKSLYANLVRCGVANVCLTQFDGRKLAERLDGQFDYVLLDAPCGGEGTVRKDPKALQHWRLDKVLEISELQKSLILTGYRCLKPGGRLVYSTCTLSPEENQQVAAHLLENSDAQLTDLSNLFLGADKAITEEGYLHVLPHTYDSEGFFVAAFVKPDTAITTHYQSSKDNNRVVFEGLSKPVKQQLIDYYTSHFGWNSFPKGWDIKQRDKEIWLFPTDDPALRKLVRFNRSGIKLAEIYPNKIRSTHEFVQCFGHLGELQKVEVSLSQAEDYYKGRNLELLPSVENAGLKQGEVILLHGNHPIGLGTLQKNKIKNQLPRDLVRDQIKFTLGEKSN